MLSGLVPMVAGEHSRGRKKSDDDWKVVSGSDRYGQWCARWVRKVEYGSENGLRLGTDGGR